MKRASLIFGALTLLVGAVGQVKADYIYIGSWEVDQGPSWTTVPPIYTGQEAAALLFGGSASNYAISTVDSNPANINFESLVQSVGRFVPGLHWPT